MAHIDTLLNCLDSQFATSAEHRAVMVADFYDCQQNRHRKPMTYATSKEWVQDNAKDRQQLGRIKHENR